LECYVCGENPENIGKRFVQIVKPDFLTKVHVLDNVYGGSERVVTELVPLHECKRVCLECWAREKNLTLEKWALAVFAGRVFGHPLPIIAVSSQGFLFSLPCELSAGTRPRRCRRFGSHLPPAPS